MMFLLAWIPSSEEQGITIRRVTMTQSLVLVPSFKFQLTSLLLFKHSESEHDDGETKFDYASGFKIV